LIENGERHVAGESGDHGADLRHRGMDLPHVHPDESVRQTGQRGERLDVLLRRVERIAAWQIGVQEQVGGLFAVTGERFGGDRIEGGF